MKSIILFFCALLFSFSVSAEEFLTPRIDIDGVRHYLIVTDELKEEYYQTLEIFCKLKGYGNWTQAGVAVFDVGPLAILGPDGVPIATYPDNKDHRFEILLDITCDDEIDD